MSDANDDDEVLNLPLVDWPNNVIEERPDKDEAHKWMFRILFTKTTAFPYTLKQMIKLDHLRIYGTILPTQDLYLLRYGQAFCIEFLNRHQLTSFRGDFGCVYLDTDGQYIFNNDWQTCKPCFKFPT